MEWMDLVRPLISNGAPMTRSFSLSGPMKAAMYWSRDRFVSFSLRAISLVDVAVGVFQREVFQFALDGVEAHAVRQRSVQVGAFAGDALARVVVHGVEVAHDEEPLGHDDEV